MATKNNTPTQNNHELIMIIAEERNTFRTLFDNFIDENGVAYIPTYEFQIMNLRSRFNPDLKYYKVNYEAYKERECLEVQELIQKGMGLLTEAEVLLTTLKGEQ